MAIAAVAAGFQIASGIGQAIFSGAAKRRAEKQRRSLQRQLSNLERNRQAIIDPFAGVQDLSSQLSNPFANLQVATEAAEIEAQQTDIALASTLDTLRATGAAGGGATALAQAALSAKQGIAANIAQQEAQNAQLRAEGEQQLQRDRIREQQRVQEARALGKQFTFEAREGRELQRLNRLSGQLGLAQEQEAAAQSAMMGGIGQAIGGIGSFAAAGGFGNRNLGQGVPEGGFEGLAPTVQSSFDPPSFNLNSTLYRNTAPGTSVFNNPFSPE